jgi:hypothetical protein
MYSLMGANDGTVYIFDPLLVEGKRIQRFNDDLNMPFTKKKRPELVRWVEPIAKQNANKFAVVWEDGSIYIYDKDLTSDPKEDFNQAIIQTKTNNGQESGKNTKNFATKADIVVKMQSLVEDFDFDRMYSQGGSPEALYHHDTKQCLYESSGEKLGVIQYTHKLHDIGHREYNFACAYFKPNEKIINPKFIIRFDCKIINQI